MTETIDHFDKEIELDSILDIDGGVYLTMQLPSQATLNQGGSTLDKPESVYANINQPFDIPSSDEVPSNYDSTDDVLSNNDTTEKPDHNPASDLPGRLYESIELSLQATENHDTAKNKMSRDKEKTQHYNTSKVSSNTMNT